MKVFITKSIILFFCITFLNAQDSHFINYSTKDGLPSREVYDVEVDQAGLIWLTTDRGVCTFDGYNFKTYTTQDGLADNVNFEIYRDSKNRLWLNGYGGGVSVFENGKFSPIKENENLVKILDGQWTSDILESTDGKIYSTRQRVKKRDNRIMELDIEDLPKEMNEDDVNESFKVYQFDQFTLVDLGENGFVLNSIVDLLGYNQPTVAHRSGDHWYYHSKNRVFKYNSQSNSISHYNLVQSIGSLYIDKDDNFWVCTAEGLYFFRDGQLDNEPLHYFQDKTITSIAEDQEGAFWVTCTQNGVYYIPSLDVVSLDIKEEDNSNKSYFAIGTLDNHIVFGGKDSKVTVLDKKGSVNKFSVEDYSHDVRYISKNEDRLFCNSHIIFEKNGKITVQGDKANFSGVTRKLNNGHLLQIASGRGFIIYDELGNPIYTSLISNRTFSSVVTSVAEIDNTIWIGTLKGLYKVINYQYTDVQPVLIDGKEVFGRVNYIHPDANKNLWIGTIGNGLFYFSEDKIYTLRKKNGLNSDMINRILLMKDTTICLATNKGVNVVSYEYSTDTLIFSDIKNFTISDGLISNFINDIKFWNDKIWLATDNGICHFNPEYFDKSFSEIPVFINEMIVNDSIYEEGQNLVLKHNQNDLQINYTGISFKKENEDSFYRFRLNVEKEASNWIYTNDKNIRYNNLAPGNYTFEVAAKNKSNIWTSVPAKISFQIKPHFIDTLWFKSLAFILFISLVGAATYAQIKRMQLREYEKRKLQEAKLNALRNQMNPHFVFNSLNSIQSFIFKKDIEKANYYLSKFSRLMRDSLQYTRLDYITLREEVDFIKNYLELEAMRFSGKFEFKIRMEESLDLEFITIPSLIIQPVLENSIKHAFNNLPYLGLLTIDIKEKDENRLEVFVQDNGSGLTANQEKNNQENAMYKSLGLEIIKDRIDLLNKKSSNPIASIDITNLSDIDEDRKGLLVHFILPIKNI